MKKRIVISGGGTGGHVFPAIAVAEALQDLGDYEFVWIGSRKGIEYNIVTGRGIPFYHVPSGKLRRYFSWENLRDLFLVLAGFVASLFILAKLRPLALFSKGGFVTVPPVLAARILGIPVVSHESDFDPGLATKINAGSSKVICVPYEKTASYFPPALASRIVCTGNPVRRDIFAGSEARARELFGLDATKPILFVQGGSLGAAQVNALVADTLPILSSYFFVIHQRGNNPPAGPEVAGAYTSAPFYNEEYAHILKASTLVLSRAGAGSLWEMGVMAKPGILLPLVAGSRGDQLRNADNASKEGACIVLPQEASKEALVEFVQELWKDGTLDEARLQSMAAAWSKVVVADGAMRIAQVVHGVVGGQDHGTH